MKTVTPWLLAGLVSIPSIGSATKFRKGLNMAGHITSQIGRGGYKGGKDIYGSIQSYRVEQQVKRTNTFNDTTRHVDGVNELKKGTVNLNLLKGAELFMKPGVNLKGYPNKVQVIGTGAGGTALLQGKTITGLKNKELTPQDLAKSYELKGDLVRGIVAVNTALERVQNIDNTDAEKFSQDYQLETGRGKNKNKLKPIDEAIATLTKSKWKNRSSGELLSKVNLNLMVEDTTLKDLQIGNMKKMPTSSEKLRVMVSFKEGSREGLLNITDFTKRYDLTGI